MNFFELIKQNRSTLNTNEENLLDYLFEHKEDIRKMTVRQIADAHFTAPNSVIRLCKKLGFSGFSEFREALYLTTSEQKTVIEMTSLDEQIIKTKQLINPDVLDAVLEKIHHANKILFFAVGLSRLASEDLHQRLQIIGKNSHTFIDPHVMEHNAKMLTSGDMVFAISVSGESDAPVYATTIAKANGATTVSLTAFSNNTLSKLTDYQFYGMTSNTLIDGIDVSERLSFVYLTNYIFNEYAKKYLI